MFEPDALWPARSSTMFMKAAHHSVERPVGLVPSSVALRRRHPTSRGRKTPRQHLRMACALRNAACDARCERERDDRSVVVELDATPEYMLAPRSLLLAQPAMAWQRLQLKERKRRAPRSEWYAMYS